MQRLPAMGATHECIIRRGGIVEIPDESGFKVGERVYFRAVGRAIHITRNPAMWPDGRYRSARIRRTSGAKRLSSV